MASEISEKHALLSARFSVRYAGKSPVLRDVRLEVQRGEVMGLVTKEILVTQRASTPKAVPVGLLCSQQGTATSQRTRDADPA